MKKLILIANIIASASLFAASPAATQDWVRYYVASNGGYRAEITQAINSTNAIATCSYVDPTGGLVTMTTEMSDKLALCATNCTDSAIALGVTNGTLFAFNGSTQFVNAVIGQTIYSPTNTCMTFRGVQSTRGDGIDTFAGYFDFYGGRITRSSASVLLGE